LENNSVKILFRFYSDVLEQETVETMWAIPVDIKKGLYQLDNIPFYAPLIASDDIVFAEYDEDEEQLTYRKTIEYSGNSTIWVVIMDDTIEGNDIRNDFEKHGCVSEKINEKYFAMEVPAKIHYNLVKEKLDELTEIGFIDYSEPCLSDIHRKQL
jgi:hypothetical protein